VHDIHWAVPTRPALLAPATGALEDTCTGQGWSGSLRRRLPAGCSASALWLASPPATCGRWHCRWLRLGGRLLCLGLLRAGGEPREHTPHQRHRERRHTAQDGYQYRPLLARCLPDPLHVTEAQKPLRAQSAERCAVPFVPLRTGLSTAAACRARLRGRSAGQIRFSRCG
jgi:hypothetical protein